MTPNDQYTMYNTRLTLKRTFLLCSHRRSFSILYLGHFKTYVSKYLTRLDLVVVTFQSTPCAVLSVCISNFRIGQFFRPASKDEKPGHPTKQLR